MKNQMTQLAQYGFQSDFGPTAAGVAAAAAAAAAAGVEAAASLAVARCFPNKRRTCKS
jgi:hypothetical protein